MIYMIVTETEEKKNGSMGGQVPIKVIIENMTGEPCLTRWFTQASLDEVRRYGVKGIFLMGFGTDIQDIPRRNYRPTCDLVRRSDVPVIGICGGHQVLGCVFGGDPWANYPMRRLRPGEPDVSPYHPGMFKEWGYYRIRRLCDDPLFAGLGRTFVAAEYHYCAVRKVPPGFRLIATNGNCRVQAFRHRQKPVYGTQFHFERFTKDYPDGRRVMANFLRICGYRKLNLKWTS